MVNLSEQHKSNISKSMKGKMPKFIPNNKGRIKSDDEINKIRTSLLGRKLSEEHIRNISNGLKGNKHTLGHKLSEDHKHKISIRNKGRIVSLETIKKTIETRRKNGGYSPSEVVRNKIRISLTGRKKSIESIMKSSGENNHNWKGGITVGENRKIYDLSRVKERRAKKKGASGHHTHGEWELLKITYANRCPSCLRSEPDIKLTEDHIVPLSIGGSDYIDNIQPLCINCNSRKHTKITRFEVENITKQI